MTASKTGDKLFDEFWQEYPRKIGKIAAQKAFGKLAAEEKRDCILHVRERKTRDAQWLKDNGQFIPHPLTFLNQGRWMDEYEVAPQARDPQWKIDGWLSPDERDEFEDAMQRWRNDRKLGVNLDKPKPIDPRENR